MMMIMMRGRIRKLICYNDDDDDDEKEGKDEKTNL